MFIFLSLREFQASLTILENTAHQEFVDKKSKPGVHSLEYQIGLNK